MMTSVGGGAYFDAGFAHSHPHAQQGMPYAIQGEAWPGAPLGMVMCAPPAPRLNAARPRLDRHLPYAHAWYPAYYPVPQPQGMYHGWQAPAYPYAAAQQPPYWGAQWGSGSQAQAYAMQAAHAQAYAAHAAHAPAYAPAPHACGVPYPTAAGYVPEAPAVPDAGAAPEPTARSPTPPPETTAVPLAAFGAEAIWRASAALVGLGPGARVDEEGNTTTTPPRSSPASAPSCESPSRLSERSCGSVSTGSLDSSAAPFTPSPAPVSSVSSVPSTPSPCSSPRSDKGALDASLEALQIGPEAAPTRADDGTRSTALHRLVREMGQNPRPFPSLDTPQVRTERPRSASRRSRTPSKHATLAGEVSPAFRHFAHQVLAQTLLSPTALVLALYYVQLLPAAIGTDSETALGLLSQPTSTTPFKLLTLGLMIANKFLDDNTFLNKTWHEVTGIPLDELNKMESYFLCRTQFHLSLSDVAWRQHLTRLRESELGSSDDRSDRALILDTLDSLLAEAP